MLTFINLLTLFSFGDKIVKMKKIKVIACIILAGILCLSTGCERTPIESRKYEYIKGTYLLEEYYLKIGEEKQNLLGSFEYFYLVLREDGMATVVYKDSFGGEYKADEYGITLKYRSGSTELINEIKIQFEMPFSQREGGLFVNYLTVSPNSSLACVKTDYSYEGGGNVKTHRAVYMRLGQVDGDVTTGFIEQTVGYKIAIE